MCLIAPARATQQLRVCVYPLYSPNDTLLTKVNRKEQETHIEYPQYANKKAKPSRRTSPPILVPRLRPQLPSLNSLTALQRRERKRLALPTLQPLPKPKSPAVIPHQRPNIRLHIPMQRQRRILALRNLALDVCDLVLGLLAVEPDDAGACAGGVGFAGCFCFRFFGFLGLLAFGGWVDVGVWMQRGVIRGDDGVPDYELGGRDGGRVRGGVGGDDVEEDLFGVPVEEGGEVLEALS